MQGKVLVTGAAGFIGSHVVRELLASGRFVRATARNPSVASFLEEFPVGEGGGLEIVKMELLDSASVDDAVAGCSDVIHCAAALYLGAMDPQKDVVDPSVVGTRNLISAIEKDGGVERIVHTSSVAAIRPTFYKKGATFGPSDWCDDATVKNNAYGLAKAEAERIIRRWWEGVPGDSRPRLVTIHPSVVIGPMYAERHLVGSMKYLDHLLKAKLPFVLKSHINMVDVRDVATAHVRALDAGVNGSRYVTHSGSLWHKELALMLKESVPSRKWATRQLPKWATYLVSFFHPDITPNWVRKNIGTTCYYDATKTESDLGIQWIPMKESIADGAMSALNNKWR